MIELTIKPVWLWAQIIGGAIFGIGFAISGYCPGTGMVAMGEGKKDALFLVFGGITGTAIFAHIWPWLSVNIINPGDLGKHTVSTALSINNWAGVVLMAFIFHIGLVAVELIENRKQVTSHLNEDIKLKPAQKV